MACRYRLSPGKDRRAIIESKSADHRRPRRVHMTRQTQVARMTRCAARRNSDLARSAHDTRKLSMSPELESRIIVRAGPGKTRNLFTGESGSLGETNVT